MPPFKTSPIVFNLHTPEDHPANIVPICHLTYTTTEYHPPTNGKLLP
jgi:hypothetical protein